MGAVDYVAKPKIGIAAGLKQWSDQITSKIRIALGTYFKRQLPRVIPKRVSTDVMLQETAKKVLSTVTCLDKHIVPILALVCAGFFLS